jgi:hypothetical protein
MVVARGRIEPPMPAKLAFWRKETDCLRQYADDALLCTQASVEGAGFPPISAKFPVLRGRENGSEDEMAEEEGFEPPIPFQVRQFSRLEPSTTRPLFLSEV